MAGRWCVLLWGLALPAAAAFKQEDIGLQSLMNYNEVEKAFYQKWGPEGRGVLVPLSENIAEEGGRRLQDNPFDMLIQAIEKICAAWQDIVNAFKFSYKEEIADKEFHNGWASFKAATRAFKGAGLAYSDSDEFFADIKAMLQIPANYSADFDMNIKFIKFFDNQTWTEHNNQYQIGAGGTDNVFTMFARNREADQKLDIFFLTCSESFKLADNYFVISESKSILGGLWSSTKLVFRQVPAGIQTKDIMFVSEYFQLLAYQEVALAMGMKVPPDPQFPPTQGQVVV